MGHAVVTRLAGVALISMAAPGLSAPVPSDATLVKLERRLFPTLGRLKPADLPATARAMLAARRARADACGIDPKCRIGAASWQASEIDLLADQAKGGDIAETRTAVRRELAGLNVILSVYGQGVPPRYPRIDGPDGVGTAAFDLQVSTAMASVDAIQGGPAALDPRAG